MINYVLITNLEHMQFPRLPKKILNLYKQSTAELESITCHMWSYSVTCHLTHWKHPALTTARQAATQYAYPQRDGRLSWPSCWFYGEMVHLSTDSPPSKSNQKSNPQPFNHKCSILSTMSSSQSQILSTLTETDDREGT